jgi:hypothetical protein
MIVSEELSVLLRLILAHLLTDFILQPSSWIADRMKNKHRSGKLYLHALITALTAYVFAGLWSNLWIFVIVLISHLLIDLWKSYMPGKAAYFIIDQLLHLLVLLFLWAGIYERWTDLAEYGKELYLNSQVLAIMAGYIMMIWPLGILIGMATERWRNVPGVNTDGLAKAGMWIGFFERFLIFTFILTGQYTAIGFLIAAKSVLRFNDKGNNTQRKTEYVLIGTLMSFSAAMLLGLGLDYLLTVII